jgi:hypothetical protein
MLLAQELPVGERILECPSRARRCQEPRVSARMVAYQRRRNHHLIPKRLPDRPGLLVWLTRVSAPPVSTHAQTAMMTSNDANNAMTTQNISWSNMVQAFGPIDASADERSLMTLSLLRGGTASAASTGHWQGRCTPYDHWRLGMPMHRRKDADCGRRAGLARGGCGLWSETLHPHRRRTSRSGSRHGLESLPLMSKRWARW